MAEALLDIEGMDAPTLGELLCIQYTIGEDIRQVRDGCGADQRRAEKLLAEMACKVWLSPLMRWCADRSEAALAEVERISEAHYAEAWPVDPIAAWEINSLILACRMTRLRRMLVPSDDA